MKWVPTQRASRRKMHSEVLLSSEPNNNNNNQTDHHSIPMNHQHHHDEPITSTVSELNQGRHHSSISPSFHNNNANSHHDETNSPNMNLAASLSVASSGSPLLMSSSSAPEGSSSPNNNNKHQIRSTFMKSLFRKLLGIFCIVSVVILWVLGGVVIQFIYGNMNYDKPFFVTYVSTNLFSIYLLGFVFIGSWRRPLVRGLKWLLKGFILLVLPSTVLNYLGIVKYSREDREDGSSSRIVMRRVNGYQKVEPSSTSLDSKESLSATSLGIINYENENNNTRSEEENVEENVTREDALKQESSQLERNAQLQKYHDVNVGKTFR